MKEVPPGRGPFRRPWHVLGWNYSLKRTSKSKRRDSHWSTLPPGSITEADGLQTIDSRYLQPLVTGGSSALPFPASITLTLVRAAILGRTRNTSGICPILYAAVTQTHSLPSTDVRLWTGIGDVSGDRPRSAKSTDDSIN